MSPSTRIQKPVESGSNRGASRGFSPATRSASWATVIGVPLGVVLFPSLSREVATGNRAEFVGLLTRALRFLTVLMLPIAVSAAGASGLDPRGAAIAVAISASASFLSPIGYQTNMMVYGPGGYRFSDYARLGWVLSLTVITMTVTLVPVLWSA